MANIFVDTNVLLDVLAAREPYRRASADVWTLCESGEVHGHVSVISLNNIHYIARKAVGKESAMRMLRLVRDVFSLVTLDGQLINQAMDAGFADFEDAIQYCSAVRSNAECIVTRNAGHFPKDGVRVMTPAEYLAGRK